MKFYKSLFDLYLSTMGIKGAYRDRRMSVPHEFEEVFSHFYMAENKSGNTVVKKLLPSFQTIMVFSSSPAITGSFSYNLPPERRRRKGAPVNYS